MPPAGQLQEIFHDQELENNVGELLEIVGKVIHEYRGGLDAVAEHLGHSRGYLIKALSEIKEKNTPKLSLEDTLKITLLTGDARILEAMTKRLGYGVAKLPEATLPAASALDQLFSCAKEFSIWLGRESSYVISEKQGVDIGGVVVGFGSFFKLASDLCGKAEVSKNDMRSLTLALLSATGLLRSCMKTRQIVLAEAQLQANMLAVHNSLALRVPK